MNSINFAKVMAGNVVNFYQFSLVQDSPVSKVSHF